MEKLTEYFKANRGTQIRLAEFLGLRPSTVSQWKSVPVEHLADVSAFTDIAREELLPEAFKPAREVPASEDVA